jgi:hypothetical protein
MSGGRSRKVEVFPDGSLGFADRATSRGTTFLEHDPEKWVPVFRKDHAQIKEIERDDDSKKRHPALGLEPIPTLSQIAANPEFEPMTITKDEFESVWLKATRQT